MKKIFLILLLLCFSSNAIAESENKFYPTAIFNFTEKGRQLSGMGEKIANLIFANLVMSPNIALVDREELVKLQNESVLTLSGMVNPQQAIQVGQLTGARIIITGTVFEIENSLMIIAKIIGTETSRVVGASVEGGIKDKITGVSHLLHKYICIHSGILVSPVVFLP